MSESWELDEARETATLGPIAIAADGTLVAIASALWSDTEGVRLSLDWHAGDDMSVSGWYALRGAMDELARTPAPM